MKSDFSYLLFVPEPSALPFLSLALKVSNLSFMVSLPPVFIGNSIQMWARLLPEKQARRGRIHACSASPPKGRLPGPGRIRSSEYRDLSPIFQESGVQSLCALCFSTRKSAAPAKRDTGANRDGGGSYGVVGFASM
jgi:hypothetical protein